MKKAQFKKIEPRYHNSKADTKKHKYMADVFVKSDILTVDFYRLVENTWSICFRTLINEKEFWNYDYEDDTWNAMKVTSMLEHKNLHYDYDYNFGKLTGEKLYVSKDSRKATEEYIKKLGGYISSCFTTMLESIEESISREQRMTAAERKHIRIQEKMQEIPDVPEDFKNFIEDMVYKDDHLLYYDKEKAYCSRCGSRTKKRADMKHNMFGECKKCGKRVRYKSIGRMQEHAENKEVLLIQKKDKELVLRYFRCSLLSTHKSKESLHYSESVRTYHDMDVEWYKKRYINYVDMSGKTSWDDKMSLYHQVSYGVKTILYPFNIAEIQSKHVALNNLPIQELAENSVSLPWKDMLRGRKLQVDIFERLYKAGLKKLAVEYIRNTYGFKTNYKQKELKKLLLISKPMLQYLQECNGGKEKLKVLQDAFEDNCGLNNAEIFELAEAGIKVSELKEIADHLKIIKLMHYLQNVKGYTALKSRYQHYKDYISMGLSMDYDFSNGTVRYPKDLSIAHNKAVAEFYQEETDKMKKKAMLENPMIKKLSDELKQKYGYQDSQYLIVPPRNAGEIIEEGRKLHHCVGGDGYLRNHNNGVAFILFMRKVESPDKPYYTIEIDPKDNRIKQYYGKNDKKPDKELVDVFLNKWKRQLNARKKKGMA